MIGRYTLTELCKLREALYTLMEIGYGNTLRWQEDIEVLSGYIENYDKYQYSNGFVMVDN